MGVTRDELFIRRYYLCLSRRIVRIIWTYGDSLHESRRQRRMYLKQVIQRNFENGGTVLIPAFSIGRTQELFYELEEILARVEKAKTKAKNGWGSPGYYCCFTFGG